MRDSDKIEDEKRKMFQRFFDSTLKLNQLRILLALSELKQVKLVAQAFHVTQPAISKQIAEMESVLGVDLIRRVGQQVEFTVFGHALTNRAREILYQVSNARKDFDSLLFGSSGKVAIGAVSTVTPVLVPQAVAAFHQRAPNAAVSLTEATADLLFPMVAERAVDLIITRTPAPLNSPHLLDMEIANDPLVLVVSRHHPLAFRIALTWQDLDGNPWIVPSRSSPVYLALDTLLRAYGITLPANCIESMSLYANAALVEQTSMICLLPKTLANRYALKGSHAILPLDTSAILQKVHIISLKENDNPTVKLMRECFEYCGQIHGGVGDR